MTLELAPHDWALYKKVFAAHKRIHIPNFLTEESARALHTCLSERTDWSLVVSDGEKTFDLDEDQIAGLSKSEKLSFAQAVDAKAAHSFQFLFESYRVSDVAEAGEPMDPVYAELFALLNSKDFLKGMREMTGLNAIKHADAQATRYRPGHFLTEHDDDVKGKGRLCAMVLNMTPAWRPDWGGLLTFTGSDGHISEAYTPSFNALNVFRIPQAHSVTYVAPYASGHRLSITGWLRFK